MDLTTMRANVRIDLMDESSVVFTDDQIDRAIVQALTEFSKKSPCPQKSTIETTADSDEIDISSLTDIIEIKRVEFPIDNFPRRFRQFVHDKASEVIRLITAKGDGEDCYVYWDTIHTLDTTSTIPTIYEDLIACGACAYVSIAKGNYTINRINTNGQQVSLNYKSWGMGKMQEFQFELRKINNTKVEVITEFDE